MIVQFCQSSAEFLGPWDRWDPSADTHGTLLKRSADHAYAAQYFPIARELVPYLVSTRLPSGHEAQHLATYPSPSRSSLIHIDLGGHSDSVRAPRSDFSRLRCSPADDSA